MGPLDGVKGSEDTQKEKPVAATPTIATTDPTILALHKRVMAKMDEESHISADAKQHAKEAHAGLLGNVFLYFRAPLSSIIAR